MGPKKKAAARNAFYFFMQEVYKVHKLKSMHEASNVASKYWEKMDSQARAPYEAQAIKSRSCKEKLTSLGVPIKDTVQWEKEKMEKKLQINRDIENIVRNLSLDPQGALSEHKFYFLHINCYVRTIRGDVVPAEIALSEYSIREGVTRVYSSFLNLAAIPQGYSQEANEVSRRTHRIPLPETKDFRRLRPICEDATECMMNIRKICFGMSLDDFDDGTYRELPPLYCQVHEISIVSECFTMIMNNSDTSNNATVYPIDTLLFYLQKATSTLKGEIGVPTLSLIQAEFDKDKFMYVPDIACEYHEEEDLAQFCSRSKVRRWAYLISDFICKDLDIEMIPNRHCQPSAKTDVFEDCGYSSLSASGFSHSALSSSSSIWDAPKPFDPDKPSSSSSRSSASTGAIRRMPMPRAEHYLEDDDEKRSPPDQGLEFAKDKEGPPNYALSRSSTSPSSCSSTNYSTGVLSYPPSSFSAFPRAVSPPSGYGPHNSITLGPGRQELPSPPIAAVSNHLTPSFPPPFRGPPAFHGHHHGPLRGDFHRAPRLDFSVPPPNLARNIAPPFRCLTPITGAASHSTDQRAWPQFANPPLQFSDPNSSTYCNANSSAVSNVNSSTFSNANSSTIFNVTPPMVSNVNYVPGRSTEEVDVKPVIIKSEIVKANFEEQPPLPLHVFQTPPPPPPPPEQQEVPPPPPARQLVDTKKRTWQDTQIDVTHIKKEKEDEFDTNIRIKQEPVDPVGNEGPPMSLPPVKIKQEPKSDDEKEEKPFKLIKIDIPGETKTPTFGRLIRVDIPH